MTSPPIVIPAFDPDVRLVRLLDALDVVSDGQGPPVILVDDGSRDVASVAVLSDLAMRGNVRLVRHPDNRGKGAALRTAIAIAEREGAAFVVTADADGQHTAADILHLYRLAAESDRVHIGVRTFGSDVPLRSRVGNLATRAIFNLVSRNKVSDTQSGLRAIPARLFATLRAIPFNRYEFEFDALFRIARKEAVVEVPIETVYEPGNPTSHFRLLADSSRIYFVLFRYALLVPLIALMEFVAFLHLSRVIDPVVAFWSVRALSLVLYFFVMRLTVFRSQSPILRQVLSYGALVALNIAVATVAIEYAGAATGSPVWGYLSANLLLAAFNFFVQRTLVFRRGG